MNRRWHNARPAIASAILALLVYAITLGGTFVYDDFDVFALDARLRAPADWWKYWTQSYNGGIDNLYRPLVSMTYALQWMIHGDAHAWPFHLVNWILHAGVAALVAECARRLMIATSRKDALPLRDDAAALPADVVPPGARPVQSHAMQVAWLAGLLFAVHPIHVEAVANIVGRAELMCAAGVIGAIALFLTRRLTIVRVLAIFGCCIVAVLSKEQGLLLPVLLLVLGLLTCTAPAGVNDTWRCPSSPSPGTPGEGRGEGFAANAKTLTLPLPEYDSTDLAAVQARGKCKEPSQPNAPCTAPAGASERRAMMWLALLLCWTFAGYIVFRESLLKFSWDRGFLDWTINPIKLSKGADQVLVPIAILGRYVALLIAPVCLSPDRGGAAIGWVARWNDPYLYAGFATIAAWMVAIVFAALTRRRAAVFCLLGLALTYGLVSNFLFLIGTNFGERLMYLPSVFFVILAAMVLTRLPRRIWLPLATIAIVLGAVRSFSYARRWNDRMSFYTISVQEQPKAIRLRMLVVAELMSQQRHDEAWEAAAAARALQPDYDEVWIQSADLAVAMGRTDDAIAFLIRAMEIRPSHKASGRLNKLYRDHPPATTQSTTAPATSSAKSF